MKIQYLKLQDIQPYEKNPRKNSKSVDTVADSIEQYGFQQPIVVDKNMVIVVGHTRYQAAKKLRLKEIPVLIAQDLDEHQIKSYRIMDNKSSEKSYWDDNLLLEELQDLFVDSNIQDLSTETGITESELNKWLTQTETEDIAQTLAAVSSRQPRATSGDIFTLGDHKIACGDSTDPEMLNKLLQSEQIDLIWEDPPYGISYVTTNAVNMQAEEKTAWMKENLIENDNLSETELDGLLDSHMRAVKPYVRPGASVYWCHDIRFNHLFRTILEKHDIKISDTLIWKKNTHSAWMVDYQKYYEPILYGWDNNAKHNWYGDTWNPNTIELQKLEDMSKEQLIRIIQNIDTNYQQYDKLASSQAAKMHPTVKPPKLIAYHILNSTKKAQIVYDGFSGSGSTLIACEKTGRKARCIEYQPKYIDVAIQRWQEQTGLQAYRQDGTAWDDIQPDIETNLAEVFDLADYSEFL